MNIIEKRDSIRKIVSGLGGQFYTIIYTKKTDGTERVMNARQDVVKYSNGGDNPCKGKDDLLPTYSMDAKGYRTIWLDGVKEIRCAGKVYKF